MLRRTLWFSVFVLVLFVVPGFATAAGADERHGGTIQAELDGQMLDLPMLKSDYAVAIQGDVATVSLVQTFANPSSVPLHARYQFPLPHEAAVYEMTLEVGAERIRAQIQEVEQAQRTFERAKSQGRAAALLREHRPNLFTQNIANLMPGLPIKVSLRYVQSVAKVDDAHELVLPLVVGPRFVPPLAGPVELPEQGAEESRRESARPAIWSAADLPGYPLVLGLDLPPAIEPERVTLAIRLDGGMPILDATSTTHALSAQAQSVSLWNLALASGRTIDNRDFVLRYRLGGTGTQAGLLAQRDARGGYFSLLIEPPPAPPEAQIVPREMVFLLDCSGSMSGLPMEASKAFMREALGRLRAVDHFRIIRFSDSATDFSAVPLAANADNIARGIAYTDSLRGEGGTMMSLGIAQALSAPPLPGSTRIVTFLTDGYIGNEGEILRLLQSRLNGARLYALGVGTGVNRFLLDEVGRVGRGFTRYMSPTENVQEVARELAGRLQSPVLTGIEIDWGGLAPEEVYPAALPDLFAGQSLRLQGRYARPGRYNVTIRGLVRGRAVTLMLPVDLPARTEQGDAVARMWARAAIAERMYQLTTPPHLFTPGTAPEFEVLKSEVTALGLKFELMTKWTAFVAVSERIYNRAPESASQAEVPLPMVEGVTEKAYARAAPFAGVAGPEAPAWAGLVLGLVLLTSVLHRPRAREMRRADAGLG